MKIIDVRISSGIRGNKIGGGTLHFNGILSYLSTLKDYEIMVIKSGNDSSNLPENVVKLNVLYTVERNIGDVQSFISILFGYFLARKNIHRLDFNIPNKNNVIVISESPNPSDILCTAYFCRKYGYKGIVYFHHIPPPFWIKTFRRGFFKSILKSVLTDISLTLVKLFNLNIAIDVKRIMKYTSFKFEDKILEDEAFIPQVYIDMQLDANYKDKDKLYDACYVGRIEEGKGIKDLVEAWKIVCRELPDAKLVIMGNLETSFGKKITDLSRKRMLDSNIIFKGFVSDEEKIKIMKNSKLFAFPSYEEGWSIAIMESIMAGLVPVMYDLPAYDYLGLFPYKVRMGEYVEFGKTLTMLLRLDKDELKSLNRGLREKINKYTLEYCTLEQITNFERVLFGY